MHYSEKVIHVTFTCSYCSTINDLTAFDVANQEVRCSRCGDVLGDLEELQASNQPPPFRLEGEGAGRSGATAD